MGVPLAAARRLPGRWPASGGHRCLLSSPGILAQHRLPDDLESTVHAAVMAWEQDNSGLARENLAAALSLAHELHYF